MKLQNPSKQPPQGFALIATISVMVLLTLIALALVSLSTIELRSARGDAAEAEAQANARLGLLIAIGKLQETLGPDARATANSSILDTDPNTEEIDGVAHKHWLGAYPTIDPSRPDDGLISPKSLRDWSLANMEWLVSASDTVDPTTGLPGDTVTLAQFITDSTATIPDGDGIDSLAASGLTKAQAGLVDVQDKSGRYSWWVADESMKARIDTRASVDGSDILDGSAVDAVAQEQSNYEIIQSTEFSSLLPSYRDSPEELEKLITHNGLQRLGAEASDSSWKDWSKLNQDKFTSYSRSLPVDVANGRLKKDLTAYFKGTYNGLDGQPMIDPRFALGADKIPTFDLVKQWANLVEDPTAPQDVVAPDTRASSPQHGIHPIITQGAVSMKLSYQVLTNTTFNPVYIFMPQIQIMNPHNVPLAAQDYIVQIGYQFQWGMQITGLRNTDTATFTGGTPIFRSWEEHNSQQPLPAHIPADNEEIEYQDNKRFFTFVIKDQAFEPGESLLFHAKPPSSGAVSGVEYNLNADTDILNSTSNDQDLNLLFNEGNLDEFFYIVSPLVGTITSKSDLTNDFKSESSFASRTDGSGVSDGNDLKMHLNLYAFQNNQPTLLHAITKAQRNSRTGNFQRPTYPLNRYQAGEIFDSDTNNQFGFKNPLINFGSSMLVSNFDIFAGGDNFNKPPTAGQPHSVLGYWNIRNQTSFSASEEWASSSLEASSWLNSFSFRDIVTFTNTWESIDNFYGNLSTDRLGGWHQSQVPDTVYPLFDYPTGPYGPLSLGSFQHANLSVYSWQPTYALGNAQAPPRFDRSTYQSTAHTNLYDVSYLLNASTWDSYYLSTIPQDTVTLEPGTRLPNSRMRLASSSDGIPFNGDNLRDENGFDRSAAHVLIHGGFNVNSTSLTAWEAFLSGALGNNVQTSRSNTESNIDTAAAMGRFFAPLLEEPKSVTEDRNSIDFADPDSWASTRTLNSNEINTLAKRIVTEVKLRGPFLSLADFVNRRLEPDGDVTNDERVYQEVLGTLQAAINKATLEDQQINYHYYASETNSGTKLTIKPEQDWKIMDVNGVSHDFDVSTDAQEAMFGLPKSKIDNDGGLIHNYAPNFLSQADVLTKIGPSITVRGDTYTIRAYGDSLDSDGNIEARAWCEAVVQRTVEPVAWDGTNDRLTQPQRPDETGFGRRFRIISFRWMNQKDVMPYSDDDAITN